MNIAFANLASSGWTAGGHYLRNLFSALQGLEGSSRPDITLLVTQGTSPNLYQILVPYVNDVIHIPETKWQRYWKSAYLRISIPCWLETLAVPRQALVSQLNKYKVDVLFSNDEYGPGFSCPLLSWIPDFQHLHLPELFTSSKIQTRNRHNARIGRFANRVMLSSLDAYCDLKRRVPHALDKTRVVPFVAQIPVNIYDVDPQMVCEQYRLPNKFFYLPNQFWVHKNHNVVIDALTQIKMYRDDIAVVCTGNQAEFRMKNYYDQLVSTVKERGLEKMMLFLGMVPQEHIFPIMRQSLALLQPSLFEGWSTTIEEVKSLGKSVIVSDIAVHKEQNPPAATFFNPHDPLMLAGILVEKYEKTQPGPDTMLESHARLLLPARTQEYADRFVRVAKEAISDFVSHRNITNKQ